MLEHGGRLRLAAQRYGIPLADWVDLSTGINPQAWPVPPLAPEVWQRLPETDDGLEAAAAAYYGSTQLLTVAGSQAAFRAVDLDAVLAAMLRCSRGQASELVTAGRVEINHLPAEKPSAPVYEGDVFTVRGKGRFALTALPGKSKKERLIIEFFQY